MMSFKISLLSTLLLLQMQSHATSLKHESTSSEFEYARKVNRELRSFKTNITDISTNPPSYMPVEDYAEFSYVLLSAETRDDNFEVIELRRLIASNLPENVKLVVLTTTRNVDDVRNLYSTWINPNRLIIATDSSEYNRNGFWARDAFPIPVKDTDTHDISLIAHQYFKPFDSFNAIAKAVSTTVIERPEIFVGGNLIADHEGNCFSIDSHRLYDLSVDEVQKIYGCKTIHLLSHISGIGDIDEVLKPINNKVMLTNQPVYAPLLRSLGYEIVFLPQTSDYYRTYVNSLIVGNTVFMPVFDIDQDLEAQKIYEDLGYKVVAIQSSFITDNWHGSIHCQTMAYPAIGKENLLKSLGFEEINI